MTKFQRAYQLRSRRRGATVVEFALLAPVLLGMLLGIMEFGWLVKNYLTIGIGFLCVVFLLCLNGVPVV